MGIKRVVNTDFWTDAKVDEMSRDEKLFMVYLLTNPFSSQLGIYEVSIRQMAFHLCFSVDEVKELLDRFEKKHDMVFYSPETNEIAVKNFLAHSILKGGAPVRDCIIKEMKSVKSKRLIAEVFTHLQSRPNYEEEVTPTVKAIISEFWESGVDIPFCNPKIYRTVDNTVDRTVDNTGDKMSTKCGQNADNENENENENDNENEKNNSASFHDADTASFTDTAKQPRKQKTNKPTKHKHGQFQNVLLTDAEFEKLCNDYGTELLNSAIDFFDAYIEEKGYKSKSHNLAIRRWVIDAVKERKNQNQQPNKQPSFQKQSKADELDDFYRMAGEWANQ